MKIFTLAAITMSLFGMNLFAEPLAVGADAPKITAMDETGKPIDFTKVYAESKLTLIYFYPKADTPGCTAQACSLRDSFAELKGDGLTVLGVSHDSPESQAKFKAKYQLPFTLIADSDGKVVGAFGVPNALGIASRQSFIIKDGKIVWTSYKAKTGDHAKEVQAAIDQLGK